MAVSMRGLSEMDLVKETVAIQLALGQFPPMPPVHADRPEEPIDPIELMECFYAAAGALVPGNNQPPPTYEWLVKVANGVKALYQERRIDVDKLLCVETFLLTSQTREVSECRHGELRVTPMCNGKPVSVPPHKQISFVVVLNEVDRVRNTPIGLPPSAP
mgnify:CR=1 FL=1